jgi:bifunctional non-homologous end joining protein LigD
MARLDRYRDKRDFSKTGEPEGRSSRRRAPQTTEDIFVVQKHAARRLHYDLRLQLDGVLKSWAVPKGPSLDPAVRRLAVHVEDHPLEYATFEGVIPEGEYGGGTVMLWDAGHWEPIGDAREGYRRGELKLRLNGHRLRGGWALVRLPARAQPDRAGQSTTEGKDWLLIKEKDEHAQPGRRDSWTNDDRSVASRRTMREIAAGAAPPAHGQYAGRQQGVREGRNSGSSAPPLGFAGVELATLVEQAPEGDQWVHEIKFDGYRVLARLEHGGVALFTRNGLDWTARFPRLATEIAELEATSAVLDGEVVAYRANGSSDFATLQRMLRECKDEGLLYMAFDLLHLNGSDTRALPLAERKRLLAQLLESQRRSPSNLRLSEHVSGAGPAFYAAACRHGLEGVVSKRAQSAYTSGRTRSWLKVKCRWRQEFVVGGYTDPAGSRTGFGALLVGTYDTHGHLRYAGKVGAGFGDADLRRLASLLKARRRASSPFADAEAPHFVNWSTPSLVIEAAFAGWTAAGRVRQAVFKGVRTDKRPRDVRREEPGDADSASPHFVQGAASSDTRDAPSSSTPSTTADTAANAPPALAVARPAHEAGGADSDPTGLRISHPDRVIYADIGMSKLDVARYYEAVAERMLPHLAGRPLTVVRCPRGTAENCFFQKHANASVPDRITRVAVRTEHSVVNYPVITDLDALLTMVQLGALEFHIWGSKETQLERPDRMVFDLDPAPEVPWKDVRTAARVLRDSLASYGLQSLAMTTGGKGLHVIVPLQPLADWHTIGAFARNVAQSLAAREPQKYTTTMAKAKRTGKIFIDTFRNRRGATAVAPYSLRARDGAPAATPLAWNELGRTAGGAAWTASSVPRRLRAQAADPWKDYSRLAAQRLPQQAFDLSFTAP